MPLDTASRFPDPDAAYRALVEAHRGLTEARSRAFDAALILVLANQLGDLSALREAIALAHRAVTDREDADE
jgi:hypothetical protein